MAAKAASKDQFVQRLVVNLNVGNTVDSHDESIFTDAYKPESKTGFIINRIEYAFEACMHAQFNTALDRIKFGISFLVAFPVGGFEADSPGVLDHKSMTMARLGSAPVEHYFENTPIVTDWTNLPDGGVLVHPVNLYGWCYTDAAIAATVGMHVTIFYLRIDLTDALHAELWQSIYIRQI